MSKKSHVVHHTKKKKFTNNRPKLPPGGKPRPNEVSEYGKSALVKGASPSLRKQK